MFCIIIYMWEWDHPIGEQQEHIEYLIMPLFFYVPFTITQSPFLRKASTIIKKHF